MWWTTTRSRALPTFRSAAPGPETAATPPARPTRTVPIAPQITSASSATFALNTAGTFTVTATGAPAPAISQSGTLPTGVTFNASTGILSGTPSQVGTFSSITFTAANGTLPNATQSFTLTVTKGSQATVTVTAPSSATYGQTGLTATASGGSGSGVQLQRRIVDGELGGAAAANYTVANPVTTTAKINAKAAEVTADDQTTTSGSGDPVFTFNVSGLVDGDSLTGVSCGVSGPHTDPGTYTIRCAGNTNTNYADSYRIST